MIKLEITAHLECAFSSVDPWSPSIDSILAAIKMKEEIGLDAYAIDQAMNNESTHRDLPLNKISKNGEWFFECSIPFYEKKQEDICRFYKKFNIDHIDLLNSKTKKIELTKNQFKNHSKTFRRITANSIKWIVVGDKKEIEFLISKCKQVGGMRGKGLGVIKKWDITETDKAIKRWVPVSDIKNCTGRVMYRGYRPSFRLVENQSICELIEL